MRLKRRFDVYKGEMETAIEKAAQQQRALRSLVLAAAASTGRNRAKILPVLAAAGAIVKRCEEDLKARQQTHATAHAKVSIARELLTALGKIASNKGEYKAILDGSGQFNPTTKSAETFGQIKEDATCAAADTEADDAITRATEKGEDEVPDVANKIVLTNQCVRTAGTACTGSTSFGASGSLSYKLTVSNDAVVVSTPFSTDHSAPSPVTKADFKIATAAIAAANTELKNLRATPDLATCTKDIRVFNTIKGEHAFKLMALKALANKPDAEKVDSSDSAALQLSVDEAYGTNGGDYVNGFWKDIDSTPVPKADGAAETTEDLRNRLALDAHSEGIARLFVKTLVDEEKKQKTKQKVDETKSEDCSSKKENECKGDCVLVEGIFKPKKKGEEENKDKNGKAASTCAGRDKKHAAPLRAANGKEKNAKILLF
uniref:Variant surface glycoprotein n=1 Tax=Trypanosoma brucei TaxID=5691 RepID=A0A1V0FZI1_9TRYP|nr:variant surface glycoprotein [Trypanosoma brucei]